MLFTEQLVWPLTQGRQWTQGHLWSPFYPAATEQGPSLLSSSLSGSAVAPVGHTGMLLQPHPGPALRGLRGG